MMPPSPGVTKANFDRIKGGMTKPEVLAILGESSFEGRGYYDRDGFSIAASWIADDGSIARMQFDGRHDEVGRVCVCGMTWRESSETPFQKIRRWLRLP